MLTVNEIKKNPSKVFSRQTEPSKKANLEILIYIEYLANSSNTNISTWDIGTLFRDSENKKASLELLKNKNEINKTFFEQKEKMKEGSTEEIQNIIKLIGNSIGTALDGQKEARILKLRNEIVNQRSKIEENVKAITEKIKDTVNSKKEMDMLEGTNSKDRVMADIEDILKGNFYQFHSFEDNLLVFTTRSDIVLGLVNVKAGVNYQVNMGKYKISLDMKTFKLLVLPHEKNMKLNDHVHPFVGEHGDVCFGNVQSRASDLLASMDVKGILNLLMGLLTTYSAESSPYMVLESFKKESDRLAKGLKPSDDLEEDEDDEDAV